MLVDYDHFCRSLPAHRLKHAGQFRRERLAPGFEPIRLRQRAAPVSAQLEDFDDFLFRRTGLHRCIDVRNDVPRQALERGDDAAITVDRSCNLWVRRLGVKQTKARKKAARA